MASQMEKYAQESDLELQNVVSVHADDSSKIHICHTTQESVWIEGWRLAAITIGTCLAMGLAQADSAIASTAILGITNDLGEFESSSWVFTAYLLTYSGFPIILARISDIVGRKQVLLTCLITFTIFSGACAASQTMLQLIMFRWIQGLGGSGLLAIGTTYGFELRPPEKWPLYSAVISLAIAVSQVSGPIIGAALTQLGHWRWIFLINAPIGTLVILLLSVSMPTRLPQEPSYVVEGKHWEHNWRRLDYLGVLALVSASVFLTAALQQAAEGTRFSAPTVLPSLILAPFFVVAFVFWQWFSTSKQRGCSTIPILSWDLLGNRIFLGALLNAFFSGSIITVLVVHIPQRLVIVNELSTVAAGVRLLPFAAVMTFASIVITIILSKTEIPVMYWFLLGSLMQVAGTAGLSQSSVEPTIHASYYGFQIVTAVGIGIFNAGLLLVTPHIVDKKHLAVANSAVIQFRILGGSVGVSIVKCASDSDLRNSLLSVLTPRQVSLLLTRTETMLQLPEALQSVVRRMFGESYNLQMLIMIGIAGAAIPASLLQWKKKAIVLAK